MPGTSDFRFGELNQRSLHRQLKELYCQPGDFLEAPVEGFIADILSPPRRIIEIQTGSFHKLKPKIRALAGKYQVKIVLPVPGEKFIVKWDAACQAVLHQRRSGQKKTIYHAFGELAQVTEFLLHPEITWEVVITKEEDHRADDGQGSWRRQGVSKVDRVLLGVLAVHSLETRKDFLDLIPSDLEKPFTNRGLAAHLGQPLAVVRTFTACLKKAGMLQACGRAGRELLLTAVS